MNGVSGQFIDEVIKVLGTRTRFCDYSLGRWSSLSADYYRSLEVISLNFLERASKDEFFSVPFQRRMLSDIGMNPEMEDLLTTEEAISFLKEALKSVNIGNFTHWHIIESSTHSLRPIWDALPNLHKYCHLLRIPVQLSETTLEFLEKCAHFGRLIHVLLNEEHLTPEHLKERLSDVIVRLMSTRSLQSLKCIDLPHLSRHVIAKTINAWLADPLAFGTKTVRVRIQKEDLSGFLKAEHATMDPWALGRRHPTRTAYYTYVLYYSSDKNEHCQWAFQNDPRPYGTTKFLFTEEFTF